jgi:hypothetical protein
MAVSSIDAVRLKTSDRSFLTRETGKGDGVQRFWKLQHAPVAALPAIEIRLNNVLTSAYTIDLVQGFITFNSAPALNDLVEFVYYWSIFTDDEVQFFLDDNGGVTDLAAAKILLAIAADASKIAKRESMAGGGGLGAVTLDTSVIARELRNTAQALIEQVKQEDLLTPAEGFTEVNWTEMNYRRNFDQRIVRES